MSTTAARVDILLQLQSDIRAISQTVSGLRSVNQEVKRVGEGADDLSRLGRSLRGMAQGVAGLFGVGFSVSWLVQQSAATLRWAGTLNDLSAQAGSTLQAFQTLTVYFADVGVKTEQLAKSAEFLRRNLQVAATDGASPLNRSLAALGLTARGLQQLSLERQFEVIGQRIAEATDKQAAYNAAVQLLGAENAPKLLAALQKLGVEGYDKIAESTAKLRLSDEQLKSLDDAGDKLERMVLQMRIIAAKGLSSAFDYFTFNGSLIEDDPARRDEQRLAWASSMREDHPMRVAIEADVERNRSRRNDEEERRAQRLSNYKTPPGRAVNERAMAPGDEVDPAARARRLANYKKEVEDARALAATLEKSFDRVRSRLAADEEKGNQKILNDEIEAGEQTLAGYRRALSQVEASPFLTDTQKRAERVRALQLENEQLAIQIENLEKMRGLPGVDDAQLTAQQRDLRNQGADNSGEIVANRALGMGESGVAGLVDYLGQIPTLAERARASVTGIAQAMESGIANALEGLIYQTMTWQQALSSIAMGVVNEIIGAFIRMAAQWITQQIVMAVFGNAIRAAQLAALAPVTAATAALWAPAATAASIATLGGAAVSGAAAAKVAIASSVIGFAEGGYTGGGGKYDVAGLVHAGEFVFPADVTAKLGPENLYGMMNAIRAPSGLGAGGAGMGVGGRAIPPAAGRAEKRERLIVHTNDDAVVKRLMQDTTYQNQVVRLNRRTRGEAGLGA